MKPLHWLVAIATFNHFAFNAARFIVTLYAAYLEASAAVIGLLAALFGLVSAFASVSLGRWVDRAGSRTPMMAASLLMTAAAVAAVLWPGLAVLFLIAPLMGIANSTFQISTQQAIGRCGEPGDRAANFALHSIGVSAATFMAPLSAGLAIDHISHAGAFLQVAAFALLPLALIGPGLVRFPQGPSRARARDPEAKSGWALLGDPKLRRAYTVATMNNAVWSVVSFIIPLYCVQVGMSATLAGTLMACLSTGTVGVRLIMRWLVRRFERWPLVLGAQSLMGIGFVFMPFTGSFGVLAFLAFLIGVGLGLGGPVSTSLMYDASPQDRVGEVVGLRMTLANVAQTVVPLLSGTVGAAFGVGPVFWFVAAAVFGDVWANRVELGPLRRRERD